MRSSKDDTGIWSGRANRLSNPSGRRHLRCRCCNPKDSRRTSARMVHCGIDEVFYAGEIHHLNFMSCHLQAGGDPEDAKSEEDTFI